MPVASQLVRKSHSAIDIDGRYQILGPLGSSLTGSSFLARHRELGRRVVVKLEHDRADAVLKARFEREAQALSRLDHPHVARLLDFGQTADHRRFMVVEHVEGRDLRQMLERWGRLPEPRVLRILDQLADALGAVHAVGLVHRNLKPENVLIGEGRHGEDLVKLTNFGLVRSEGAGFDDSGTKTGAMQGTPRYWAPEQVLGEPADARTDVYAFGVLAYELLTGRPPFLSSTVEGFAWQHVHQRVPRALDPNGRPRIRPQLEAVLARCLAKHPNERFASMREVRKALRATRRVRVQARAPTLAERVRGRLAAPETWIVVGAAFLAGLLGALAGR